MATIQIAHCSRCRPTTNGESDCESCGNVIWTPELCIGCAMEQMRCQICGQNIGFTSTKFTRTHLPRLRSQLARDLEAVQQAYDADISAIAADVSEYERIQTEASRLQDDAFSVFRTKLDEVGAKPGGEQAIQAWLRQTERATSEAAEELATIVGARDLALRKATQLATESEQSFRPCKAIYQAARTRRHWARRAVLNRYYADVGYLWQLEKTRVLYKGLKRDAKLNRIEVQRSNDRYLQTYAAHVLELPYQGF